ncbi:MAG TPA: ankyrin repeat domain-containing protein [Bryobacteraceae bacterium]|jgi:ankyrin repeat protein|nr:ankyrin repeat domain-containing protein [Bryobacteraceae bacterium]
MYRFGLVAFLTLNSLWAASGDDTTALHRAVYRDDIEEAKALLRSGADAKAANRYGLTPLFLACTNGNGRMVELLISAGADPNSKLPGGETALMTAARTGKVDAVKALLAHGADVHAKEDRRGQNALMWAAAEGHVEVVKALIAAGADIHSTLATGYTPFLLAVREGHIGVAEALLQAGADVNETIRPREASGPRPASGAGAPREGTTALHLAVVNAHFELASKLLDRGANPNAVEVGYAPLHIVSWVRKPGLGDNDPAPRGSGNMNSLEIVKKLVASGADVNLRMTKKLAVGLTRINTVGATPFFLAARTGDAELMKALAALGADPKIPNAEGSTPLMAAAGLGTRSPGEDAGSESEVVEAVQVALDLGNDINAVDNLGETAMHSAAYKNLPAVVRLLAAKGADVNVWNRKNKHGWTPLTIARGYRFGNFKPSPDTVAAIEEVLTKAGVPIEPPPGPAVTENKDYRKP